jgi:hypothetical protein
MRFFAKAGVHYTTVKATSEILGISFSAKNSDFGLGDGLGLEYALAEKIALVVGGTVKIIFSEGDTGIWFKFYGGINFGL